MGWFFIFAIAAVVIFFVVRRKDYGRPKECEATITKKSVTTSGGESVYTYTCQCKDGQTRVVSTREGYYGKLQEGMNGMLAYKRKALLDFEPFKTY